MDEVFNIISKVLDFNGNVYVLLEKYFKFLNKYEKQYAKEFDSKYEDYRDIYEEGRTKHINKNFNKLPIHQKLQKINLDNVLMDFDATPLYPFAMLDENSKYPKIETGFAFKAHMKKTYVDALNNQIFYEDGNESAILRIKYYNRPDLIFHYLQVKVKIKNIEVNRMRNGYIIDALTSVDICEIIETGGTVIETYENVVFRENFKISPFRKVTEKVFALRQNKRRGK